MFNTICQIILYVFFALATICALCFAGVITVRFVAEAAKELVDIKDEFFKKEEKSHDL